MSRSFTDIGAMPSKARDDESERAPREKRHKSVRSSRKSTSKDRLRSSTTLTSPNTPSKRRTSMPVPELEKRPFSASPSASKTSLAYPSFSKAHSKEAVGSRDNVASHRLSYYTPDPTDIDQRKKQSEEEGPNNVTGVAPPSPPLTYLDQPPKAEKAEKAERSERTGKVERRTERADRPERIDRPERVDRLEKVERKRTDLQKAADELKRKLSRATSVTDEKAERHHSTKSRASNRDSKDDLRSPRRSKTSTPSRPKLKSTIVEDAPRSRRSLSPLQASFATGTNPSTIDSDATSVAPNQPNLQPPRTPFDRKLSPPTEPDSSPRTPTLTDPGLPPSRKETPAFSILSENYTNGAEASPMPPPPPPPPNVPFQQPKVDYLLHNGGLLQNVPKNLLGVGASQPQDLNAPPIPHAIQVTRFFAPFHNVLDDYTKVVSKNGSMAVATGYRSIARRLLDRLEAVFARDISSETCTCIVCQSTAQPLDTDGEEVSWGEILEYVSGRRELPQWPAFVLDSAQVGLGISAEAPCQKLDVDVPEEYKEHYINQSKKTKQAVNSWLQSQPSNPVPAPQDVDDETLTFAMLTRLEPFQRPTFSALVGVTPSRPASTASTVSQAPTNTPESDLLSQTALAIQRLYRLSTRPRDPESAIYLLTNPHLHNVLATLAAISDHEWDILTSGRFDGFLRSGAEDNVAPFSRGPTPSVPMSRGTTPAPASAGAPVALDEETEIAVLAEVEREIFLGMEALEDAFEALHMKAETVRLALRERGAGLSMASQARRGGDSLDARLGTPASQAGGAGKFDWESETDDGWGNTDAMSEIAPDDSASNVSRSRRRRPRRREERRTPAPVEEEDED